MALRVLELLQGEFNDFKACALLIPNIKNHFKGAQTPSTVGKARQENLPSSLSTFR